MAAIDLRCVCVGTKRRADMPRHGFPEEAWHRRGRTQRASDRRLLRIARGKASSADFGRLVEAERRPNEHHGSQPAAVAMAPKVRKTLLQCDKPGGCTGTCPLCAIMRSNKRGATPAK